MANVMERAGLRSRRERISSALMFESGQKVRVSGMGNVERVRSIFSGVVTGERHGAVPTGLALFLEAYPGTPCRAFPYRRFAAGVGLHKRDWFF